MHHNAGEQEGGDGSAMAYGKCLDCNWRPKIVYERTLFIPEIG